MQALSFTLFTLLFASFSAHAQVAVNPSPTPNYTQLEKRLRNLEKRVDNSLTSSEENDRGVKSYLNTKLMIGGFFETAITSISKSGQDTQVSAGSNTLGINLGAEFSDNLRFVTQFLTYISAPFENEHGDPRAASVGLPARGEYRDYAAGALLTQGYMEWGSDEVFNIQAGMGFVPFGITFQQLELVLFVRRNGPQILRTSDLVFPLWQGLHIHGILPTHTRSRLGYDAYTFSPTTNAKTPGAGARVWWKSPEENLNLGISTQVRKVDLDTVTTLGLDAKVKFDRLTLTSEFAKGYGSVDQPWSFYVEPDFEMLGQNLILYTFIDYLVNPINQTRLGSTPGLPDPFSKWQYGTGVNWLPTSFTRLRAGVTFNDYVGQYANANGADRNYWSLDLSAGVAF